MVFKLILISIALVGIAFLLFSVKILIKKNGRFEKSCTAKHRVLHQKGIDCTNCGKDPMTCEVDNREHKILHSSKSAGLLNKLGKPLE